MHKVAIVIGRFQPVHNGHVDLIRAALAHAQNVLVMLGSSGQAETIKNPFSASFRARMISADLTHEESQRVRYFGIEDFNNDAAWVANIQTVVQGFFNAYAGGVASKPLLVGHTKDDSSYYLRLFPHWDYAESENKSGLNATQVREALFAPAMTNREGDKYARFEAVESVKSMVGPRCLEELAAWVESPAYARLAAEYRYVTNYKASWSKAPYAPTFVTVDAVVNIGDKVLLIRRGGQPGNGLRALPGGYLDPHETTEKAALRELREETNVSATVEELLPYLKASKVFDDPRRSLVGRVITHAYHFDLTDAPFARNLTVHAGDDAAQAGWEDVKKLQSHEFHDDHFKILKHFIGDRM